MSNKERDIQTTVEKLKNIYDASQINAAYFICHRHINNENQIALFYEDSSGYASKWTFKQLSEHSKYLAGFLQDIGIKKADNVAVMLPKCPEIIISALSIWHLGAVYIPLFTAFGPDAIDYRLIDSNCNVVITDENNYHKILETNAYKNGLLKIITVRKETDEYNHKNSYNFWAVIKTSTPIETYELLEGNTPMILIYTSGTTGVPKGVMVPIKALASFEAYMRFGLYLNNNDNYWNMADPGWAYGLYYNLIGAMLLGKSTLFYNAPFEPEKIYYILEKYKITNFTTAPTAYRVIKALDNKNYKKYKICVAKASSAGEPLNPEVIEWFKNNWGTTIHDHYGQTEIGMVINNHHHPSLKKEIKIGSMGHSMPGFRMTVVDNTGAKLEAFKEGHLAVDIKHSPLMWFQGYFNESVKNNDRLINNSYYLTGDKVSYDNEGYFYFSGRSDDIILSAGYRISPLEVENAIMKHESVAEVAVVGIADKLKSQTIKAYIVLKKGIKPTEELAEDIKSFVKTHLSAHQYPKYIEFIDYLPKTPSGKIQRFMLKNNNH